MILKPGMWVRLRCAEEYNEPWDVVGVVADIDADEMKALVRFGKDGDPDWVPIVDLILIPVR